MEKRALRFSISAIITSLLPLVCFIAPFLSIITLIFVAIDKPKKYLTIIIVFAVLSFPISGVMAFLGTPAIIGISYLTSKYIEEKTYQQDQDIVVAPPPPPLSSFDLPDIATKTKDQEPHYVKVKISLAYEMNPEISSELIARAPQLNDIVKTILSSKSIEDLDSVEDSIALREEIKAHVNQILLSGKITEVNLLDFVIN